MIQGVLTHARPWVLSSSSRANALCLSSMLSTPKFGAQAHAPLATSAATRALCWRQQLQQSVSPVRTLAPRQQCAKPTSWALSHVRCSSSTHDDSAAASTNGLPRQQQQAQTGLATKLHKGRARGRKTAASALKSSMKEVVVQEEQHTDGTQERHATATAFYLGKELNLKLLRDHYRHALWHVAPDYCLLSYAEQPLALAPVQEEGSSAAGQPVPVQGADAGVLEVTEGPVVGNVNKDVPLEGNMAVFSSGSVVFYSSRAESKEKERMEEQQQEEKRQEDWLKVLESFVSRDSILDGMSYSPATASDGSRSRLGTEVVKLQVGGPASLKKVFTKGPDLVILQKSDLGTTEILSRVLAQSVAIDVYTSTVDLMLWRLEGNLDRIRKSTHRGPLQKMAQKVFPSFLLELAHNLTKWFFGGSSTWEPDINQGELSLLLTDASTLEIRLMSKLGLMDKSHTPWESDKHDAAWQGLRSYFDIEKRQGQVEKKMDKITTKTNDMLETRRSAQAHYIENVITLLIAIEIVMTVFFHFFDGGLTANTAATASNTGQTVELMRQQADMAAQHQATLSKVAESLQAMQQTK